MNENEFDNRILELAADDKSATEIAAILSLSPGFVRKRFLDPLFSVRLAEAKGAKVSRIATRSTKLLDACFDLLEQVITGQALNNVVPRLQDRLTAAKIVVESSRGLRMESQYNTRLAVLEATLKEAGIEPPPVTNPDEQVDIE
jgi:hypothetical protein